MRKWLPLVAICLGTFMLLIDVTIVNVALPSMVRDLHSSFTALQWVVDAYALALAALVMGIGSAADIFGHRRVQLIGLVLFAVASLVCGLAPDVGVLIASRAVQGLGGAAMVATTFALINSTYQGRDRGTAYGLWGAVTGAAASVGPVLGGLLTEGLSWRWIFFVNLPVSVGAILLVLFALRSEQPRRGQRIDVPGTVVFTVSAAALTYAMIRSAKDGWASAPVLGLLAAGLLALALFVAVELRTDQPLLYLGLLRNRTFTGSLLVALATNFSAFAYFTYTAIWLQGPIGMSPITSGLTGLPLSAMSFVISAVFARRVTAESARPAIGVGMLLVGVSALILALQVGSGSSWPALMIGFVVCGVGVGLAIPILSSTALAAVSPERSGMASGALNTCRQLGFAFGIAVLGSAFTSGASRSLTGRGFASAHTLANTLASGQTGAIIGRAPASARQQTIEGVHAAFASGLDEAFLVAGVVGVLGAVAAYLLIHPTRRTESASASVPRAAAAASAA